jgi:peptidoglycan/LPS O-acetylase OafA/YrhL
MFFLLFIIGVALVAGFMLVLQPWVEALSKDTTEEAKAKRARTFRMIRMVLSGIVAFGIIFLVPSGSDLSRIAYLIGFGVWAAALVVDATSESASASATAIGLISAGILVLLLAAGASKNKSGQEGVELPPVRKNWQNDEGSAQAMMDHYMDAERKHFLTPQGRTSDDYGSYMDVDI